MNKNNTAKHLQSGNLEWVKPFSIALYPLVNRFESCFYVSCQHMLTACFLSFLIKIQSFYSSVSTFRE